jgi:hypothetical protein
MIWLGYLIRPFVPWLIGGAVVIAAALGGWGYCKVHYTKVGYARAINEIAANDRKAIDEADQARMRVRACRDAGGVWDVTQGICGGR